MFNSIQTTCGFRWTFLGLWSWSTHIWCGWHLIRNRRWILVETRAQPHSERRRGSRVADQFTCTSPGAGERPSAQQARKLLAKTQLDEVDEGMTAASDRGNRRMLSDAN